MHYECMEIISQNDLRINRCRSILIQEKNILKVADCSATGSALCARVCILERKKIVCGTTFQAIDCIKCLCYFIKFH